jgi:hypothetical protein
MLMHFSRQANECLKLDVFGRFLWHLPEFGRKFVETGTFVVRATVSNK